MPSLSPRDVQTGASVDNGHMLSDDTNHRRILKETEKQSGRVTIVATIVWVGNCAENAAWLSHTTEWLFGLQVQMSSLLHIPAS